MHKTKPFFIILIAAVAIKLFLFAFACTHVPGSDISSDSDSPAYLSLSGTLYQDGVFAIKNAQGNLEYEMFRTPGYPIFLSFFHRVLKIPLSGIIFIQILLSLVSALIVYNVARKIDERMASLAMAIILFDISIMAYSLMIMTEILFLFFISIYMFTFFKYLENRAIPPLLLSAIIVAIAAYIRPVGLYFGAAITIFIVYANIHNPKKAIIHAGVFFVVVYSLIGAWLLRNYLIFHTPSFSSILAVNKAGHYAFMFDDNWNRGDNPQWYSPLFYHARNILNRLIDLMARPGSLKYLKYPPINIIGKVLGYPWMVFWLLGFFVGIFRAKKNIYLQAMIFAIAYFIAATIGGALMVTGERLRIPMLPFIAVISAFGWFTIWKKKYQS